MKHKCDENNLLLLDTKGTLTTYICPICGKKFCELGSIIPIFKPIKKCKLFVKWSKEDSNVNQINNIKKIIPSINGKNNKHLLELAKKGVNLDIGEMYLSEAQELVETAKKQNVTLIIEEI